MACNWSRQCGGINHQLPELCQENQSGKVSRLQENRNTRTGLYLPKRNCVDIGSRSETVQGACLLPAAQRTIWICKNIFEMSPAMATGSSRKRSRTPNRFPIRQGPFYEREFGETPSYKHAGSKTILNAYFSFLGDIPER